MKSKKKTMKKKLKKFNKNRNKMKHLVNNNKFNLLKMMKVNRETIKIS